MNPKEFDWDESQQVTVVNPTEEDYHFKVHNKDYVVKAGTQAKMVGFMAWMYVHGLAVQMAQTDKVFTRWNEEGFRNDYYEKLVVAIDDVVQVMEPELQVETVGSDGEDEEETTDSDVRPMKRRRTRSVTTS